MGFVSLLVKIRRRRPQRLYTCMPLEGDEELGSAAYPMVIVQIPMYNEKEVIFLTFFLSIRLSNPLSLEVSLFLSTSSLF